MTTAPFQKQSRFGMRRVGGVAEVRLGKMLQSAPTSPMDRAVSYLRAGSLGSLDRIEELPQMFASPREVTQYAVRAGDLVVSEGGDVGRTAFVPHDLRQPTIIQNSLHRVRPYNGDVRFLKYALDSVYWSGWLNVVCNRSTFGHLTVEKLSGIAIPWPSAAQQRVIADYLDTEINRIDGLIGLKQQLVEAVRNRTAAMIDELVWDGVSRQVPLRRVTRFVDYRGATPEKSGEGVPLITATHVKGGRLDLAADPQFLSVENYTAWMRRGFPRRGDVIITTEAPLGEVAQIADEHVALAQRLILLKLNALAMNADYLAFALQSSKFQALLHAHATGSTALGIKADRLKGLPIPFPELHYQSRVATELRRRVELERRLREQLAAEIALLREHRRSLVSAAVTGEMEMAGVA